MIMYRQIPRNFSDMSVNPNQCVVNLFIQQYDCNRRARAAGPVQQKEQHSRLDRAISANDAANYTLVNRIREIRPRDA
jgi:hypothetical protein